MNNEATTCRKYVEPKLNQAGWKTKPHDYIQQYYFTDGKICPKNQRQRREKKKFVDYLLLYSDDFPLAVVEAKRQGKTPDEGIAQAKNYAQILGLKFAYSTNGNGIVEYDFTTGLQSEVMESFPHPDELWRRLKQDEELSDEIAQKLLTPFHPNNGKYPRYYQRIAINKAVQAILKGQRRLLLTMATGTGKTSVAFQICWKLQKPLEGKGIPRREPGNEGIPRREPGNEGNEGTVQRREPGSEGKPGFCRPPRILFLADRNVLVDDPMNKDFSAFSEDKIHKIQGKATKGREIYFAIYQAIALDKKRPGLYNKYSRDYFDLIIVDECHRGSARDESNWREILEYFAPAYQLGLTATPLRADNIDTYQYFGNPLYTYSLKQGIEDGFLAPYRVWRVTTTWDRDGYRPTADEIDIYGRRLPDEEYRTPDFERQVVLKARTKIIAKHITDYLKKTNRFAKTIVFCVDEDHVKAMVRELNNLNSDLTQKYPNYVCRITAAAGEVGKEHLYEFKHVQKQTHIIAVTAKLLTTGVDVPTCENIIIVRVIRSMTDFKQIIGRGTRVYEEGNKFIFNIIDYTNSTILFEDREFDGVPALIVETEIDEDGETFRNPVFPRNRVSVTDALPNKYIVDGGEGEIAEEKAYELDANHRLRLSRLVEHTREQVRTLVRTLVPIGSPPGNATLEVQQRWGNPVERAQLMDLLAQQGIDFDELKAVTQQPNADICDLLCHIAFDAPVLTCRQRAERLRSQKQDFFEQYGEEAKVILEKLLDKYAENGVEEFNIPTAFKANQEFQKYGNVAEIAQRFGGVQQLREAVHQLQIFLYATTI